MKRNLKLYFIYTLVLFFAFIFINTSVHAKEAVTLTQADFTEAKNSPGEDTGKMKYIVYGNYAYYFMTDSDYVLGEDINIGAANVVFYMDYVGENSSLDLSKYTIQNGTNDEYETKGVSGEKKVIIFQNTNATITGTGTIKSNTDDYALTVLEYSEEGNTKIKEQKISNINVQGGMLITETKATISNVKSNGTLKTEESNITIEGGSYTNNLYAGAANFSESNVTINTAIFTANGASSIYFFGEDNNVLTINSGLFTSAKDNGAEVYSGTININNGTFEGAMSGITIDGYKSLNISGGTFTYTDIENGRGPIALYSVEVEDAEASIANNKVLSEGKFEKVEKTYGEGDQSWNETYITIKAETVTVKSETEDTTKELSTEQSSDPSSVTSNIKFTEPISADSSLEVEKTDNELIEELKSDEPNLKIIFDINVLSGTGEVIKIENNKMTIKIKLDKDLLGYKNYQVVYIENGKIIERIPATVKDDYITFETTHLSKYGVIATNAQIETIKNPSTGDNIISYIILSIISIISIICTALAMKKNNQIEKA